LIYLSYQEPIARRGAGAHRCFLVGEKKPVSPLLHHSADSTDISAVSPNLTLPKEQVSSDIETSVYLKRT
jgi:hypothetical protein